MEVLEEVLDFIVEAFDNQLQYRTSKKDYQMVKERIGKNYYYWEKIELWGIEKKFVTENQK